MAFSVSSTVLRTICQDDPNPGFIDLDNLTHRIAYPLVAPSLF
jgi:hypothetical protein